MRQILGWLPAKIPDLYRLEKDPSTFHKLVGVVDALTMDQNVVIERAFVCASVHY